MLRGVENEGISVNIGEKYKRADLGILGILDKI